MATSKTGRPWTLSAFLSIAVVLGSLSIPHLAAAAPDSPVHRRPASKPRQDPPASAASPALSTVTDEDGLVVKNLGVPYVNQVYDLGTPLAGQCSCGPTSLAMVLAYFGRIDARGISVQNPAPHTSEYGWAVTDATHTYGAKAFDRQILGCGGGAQSFGGLYGALMVSDWSTMTDWQLMNNAISDHGLSVTNYGWGDATFDVVKEALDRGNPVILATNLTGVGHIVVATGYTSDNRLVVNDPFGDKNAGYPNDAGEGALYTWADLGGVRQSWEVSGTGEGWLGHYADARGVNVARYDREISFDWGGQAPLSMLQAEGFSADWTRSVWFDSGRWTVEATADGNLQVLVDGHAVIDQHPGTQGAATATTSLYLSAGTHDLRVLYRHTAGSAAVAHVAVLPDSHNAR